MNNYALFVSYHSDLAVLFAYLLSGWVTTAGRLFDLGYSITTASGVGTKVSQPFFILMNPNLNQ